MIDVSQAYRDSIQGRVIRSRIEILVNDGTETTVLSNKDIITGSAVVNWRASNNKELTLGTCYASSFSFSSTTSIPIGEEGQELTIIPSVYYLTEDGEEQIKLGVFRCSEQTVFARTTSYECLDDMLRFDKTIESRVSGTPYNLLAFICEKCGVTLGNTSQEITAMINSDFNIVIDPEYLGTYRDALKNIGTILGGYCILGRDGKFYVRHYHTEPDITIPKSSRAKSTFAGYETKYAGVEARFLVERNYYKYAGGEGGEGLMLNLGDLPIIEGDETLRTRVLNNIWVAIISQIDYYPMNVDIVGDPSIEAGDMIETPDQNGIMKNAIITSATYKWRTTENLLSEGANPKIKAVTTESKKSQSESDRKSKDNELVTATFANANTIDIEGSGQSNVTSIRFMTNKSVTAIFGGEFPMYSDGDGYVEIEYQNNGIAGDKVKARLHEGWNLVTLVNHLYYESDMVILLTLKAKTYGLNGGSAPTATIDPNTIRSYIFGQGISTEAGWDGIITISEDVEYVTLAMAMYGITDSVSVDTYFPVTSSLQAVVDAITSGVIFDDIDDTMSLEIEYGDQILRMGMGHRAGAGRMFAPLITGGE